MRKVKTVNPRLGLLAGGLFLLVGCATQLAPLYDRALVDGLTSINADTLELISAASDGTTKDSFPSREPKYNKVIGKLDALALQAGARPTPSNNITEAVKKIGSRNASGSPGQVVPSSTAIQEISKTIVKMRDTDKKQGVTGFEVQAFKGQVLIYMDQALTYEAALER